MNNPKIVNAQELLHTVKTYFGETTIPIIADASMILRILIAVSATTLIAAFVQLLMSFFLLFTSIKVKLNYIGGNSLGLTPIHK